MTWLRADRLDGEPAQQLRLSHPFADSGTMSNRSLIWGTAGAFALGMGVFVGLRWGAVYTEMATRWPEVLWFALPLAATYAGAAAMGVILVRDGVKRWWWLPAVLFVALGLPVESWVHGSSFLATRLPSIVGAAVDALLVLAPAVVLLSRTHAPRVEIVGRVVPVVFVFALSVAMAMVVGQTGPDVSLSVGLALLSFGALSQSSSWLRALSFVAIALALGAQVPSSFATAISQGYLGPLAVRDASLEVVIALFCFAIAPLSRAWEQLLARRAGRDVPVQA